VDGVTNPVQPDPDAPLGFLLGAAARKLAKFYAAALAGGPVTPSQLFFLRQLWLEDAGSCGLPLSELRLRAQLDATSATWLADQLEKAGLIERRRDDPDRRVVRVRLTSAGRELREALTPRIARWEASLTAQLERQHSSADVAAFRAVLDTLIATLPDGADLWASLSASWDTSLATLRQLLEAEQRESDRH
jgi:DNA-binding MarR family transcriptional regulator